ncbi:bile acid:sodium symporter family protein [Actinomadura xylanilytica]|uniref:bile acid:sodium symporter family protein n=1 Tax=Actinomadura xylanilytica TaxID=887459 RepID=UPI00255B22B2|nr:bile acid:sodium symporter family protein [Actinomadura xylanilytica]MDL4773237.1 bile acid:sodium symporter family protein [Actinomadura xylanilytica]
MRVVSAALARLHIDPYIAAILCTVGIAAMWPARGGVTGVLDLAGTIAITLLFFFYGARLSTTEALSGLRHWRLHAAISFVTFAVFPVLALTCAVLVPEVLDEPLYAGVVFLCVLPSTVQSSITLTSIAKGNEAGAICSASLSNLVGVVLTPVLVAVLISAGDGGFSLASVGDIMVRLLLPFLAGQAAQRWIGDRVRARRGLLGLYDRGVILLVVYTAFSQGVVSGVWSGLAVRQLVLLALVIAGLLALALGIAALLARAFGFSRADRVAILFCGSQKSLASGLPMATVLFAGAAVSTTVLPLMLYHQFQLLVCSWLAQRFAKRQEPRPVPEPAHATA